MMVPTHVPQPNMTHPSPQHTRQLALTNVGCPFAVEEQLERTESIYALTVTKVVQTGWHFRTVRLVWALFFTVFLQLALVGLLWQVKLPGEPDDSKQV